MPGKFVCTQFLFAYTRGCLHCCSSAQYCVSRPLTLPGEKTCLHTVPVCLHERVFALLQQRTVLCIPSANTAWWTNLFAHGSCLLTRPGVCTAAAAHSTVYPVCYHCLVNKLVCTQFVLVYYVLVFVQLQKEVFIVLWTLFALAVC